jgi:hypothetical protein
MIEDLIDRMNGVSGEGYRFAGEAAEALAAQRAEIERLRKALEWYSHAVVVTIHPKHPGLVDDGNFARQTLLEVMRHD